MIYRCPEDNRVMDATTTKGKFKCPRCGKFWDAIVHTAPDGLALAEMVIEAGTGKLTGGPIQPHYVDWIAIVAAARALVEKVGGK